MLAPKGRRGGRHRCDCEGAPEGSLQAVSVGVFAATRTSRGTAPDMLTPSDTRLAEHGAHTDSPQDSVAHEIALPGSAAIAGL